MKKIILFCVFMFGLSIFSQNKLFEDPKYRIPSETIEKQILIWIENKKYYVGDKVSVIIESNFDLDDYYSLVAKLKKNIQHKHIETISSSEYENGKERHSLVCTFKVSSLKKIKIKPVEIIFEGCKITSNSLKIKIKK